MHSPHSTCVSHLPSHHTWQTQMLTWEGNALNFESYNNGQIAGEKSEWMSLSCVAPIRICQAVCTNSSSLLVFWQNHPWILPCQVLVNKHIILGIQTAQGRASPCLSWPLLRDVYCCRHRWNRVRLLARAPCTPLSIPSPCRDLNWWRSWKLWDPPTHLLFLPCPNTQCAHAQIWD